MISWIACLAILMGSIAPTMSHALQRQATNVWMEVCTTAADRSLNDDADAGKRTPDGPIDHQFQHCPWCGTHANALGMPPACASVPEFSAPDFTAPEHFVPAPRALFAWNSAQPRAPPRNA